MRRSSAIYRFCAGDHSLISFSPRRKSAGERSDKSDQIPDPSPTPTYRTARRFRGDAMTTPPLRCRPACGTMPLILPPFKQLDLLTAFLRCWRPTTKRTSRRRRAVPRSITLRILASRPSGFCGCEACRPCRDNQSAFRLWRPQWRRIHRWPDRRPRVADHRGAVARPRSEAVPTAAGPEVSPAARSPCRPGRLDGRRLPCGGRLPTPLTPTIRIRRGPFFLSAPAAKTSDFRRSGALGFPTSSGVPAALLPPAAQGSISFCVVAKPTSADHASSIPRKILSQGGKIPPSRRQRCLKLFQWLKYTTCLRL